jgi:hypothetical protein
MRHALRQQARRPTLALADGTDVADDGIGEVQYFGREGLSFCTSVWGLQLRPTGRGEPPALAVPRAKLRYWCVHPHDKKAFIFAFDPEASTGATCRVAVLRVTKKAHRLAQSLNGLVPHLGAGSDGPQPVQRLADSTSSETSISLGQEGGRRMTLDERAAELNAQGSYAVTLLGDVYMPLTSDGAGNDTKAAMMLAKALPRPYLVTLGLSPEVVTLTSNDLGEVIVSLNTSHVRLANVIDDPKILKLLKRGGLSTWREELLVIAEQPVTRHVARFFVMQVRGWGDIFSCVDFFPPSPIAAISVRLMCASHLGR